MDREGSLRAIRRPAELYGGRIDADLAGHLIADAGGGQGALPLIQHALMLLWNLSEKLGSQRRLGLDLYRRQKGAALLSDHADQAMASAAPDPPQQTMVERPARSPHCDTLVWNTPLSSLTTR